MNEPRVTERRKDWDLIKVIEELLIGTPHDAERAERKPYYYCRWCHAHRAVKDAP